MMRAVTIKRLNQYRSKNYNPVFDPSTDSLKILSKDDEVLLIYDASSYLSFHYENNGQKDFVILGKMCYCFPENAFEKSTVSLTAIILNNTTVIFRKEIKLVFTLPDNIVHESEYIEAELRFSDHLIDSGVFAEIHQAVKQRYQEVSS